MIAGFSVDTRENLLHEDNQIDKGEEDYVEVLNPWNKDIKLLERMLERQDLIQEEAAMEEEEKS